MTLNINIILFVVFLVIGIISYQRSLSLYVTIFIFSLSVFSLVPLLPIFSSNSTQAKNDPTINTDGTCSSGYQCIADVAPGNIYVSSVDSDNGQTARPQGLGNSKCIPSDCFNLHATTKYPSHTMYAPLSCGTDTVQPVLDTVYPNGICSLTATLTEPITTNVAYLNYEDINGSTCDKDLLNVGLAVYRSCDGDCDNIPTDGGQHHNDYSTLDGIDDAMTNGTYKETEYATEILKSLKAVGLKYGKIPTQQTCKLIDTINSQKTARYITDKVEHNQIVYSCPTQGYYDPNNQGKGDNVCTYYSDGSITSGTCDLYDPNTSLAISDTKGICSEYRKFCDPLETGSISYFKNASFNNVSYTNKDGKNIVSSDGLDGSQSPYSCGVAVPNKSSGGTSSSLWVSNKPECKKAAGELPPPAEYSMTDADNKYSVKCVGFGASGVSSCGFQYANTTDTYHAKDSCVSCDNINCGGNNNCGGVCGCNIGQTCVSGKCNGTICFDGVKKSRMNIYTPDNKVRTSGILTLKSTNGVYFRSKNATEIAYTLQHEYKDGSGDYPYPVTIYMWSVDGGKTFQYYFTCVTGNGFNYPDCGAEIYARRDGLFTYTIRSSFLTAITNCGFQVVYHHDRYNDYVEILANS